MPTRAESRITSSADASPASSQRIESLLDFGDRNPNPYIPVKSIKSVQPMFSVRVEGSPEIEENWFASMKSLRIHTTPENEVPDRVRLVRDERRVPGKTMPRRIGQRLSLPR
jgi:hypothetical protein